jgi:hypothetical protein
MSDTHKLDPLFSDFEAIFNNIEWNLGATIGIASIVINPKLIYLNNAPLRINVDGLDVDGFQCLGVALLEKDRMPRMNEIIAMAKRSLVCESLELAADFLVRASRIMYQGIDPYEKDQYFSVDIRELWNSNKGKAGELIDRPERQFLENLVYPLRNLIRHNNGKLLPKKSIRYNGQHYERSLNIDLEWIEGNDNNIVLQLNTAHDIFVTVRHIVEDGFGRARTIVISLPD